MKMDWPSINRDVDAVALRGTKRDSMFVKATLHVKRTGHDIDIVIRNVSAGGMLADSAQMFAIGDQAVVTLRKIGAVPGRIVWVQAGRFGMAFDVAIDPQDVRKPVTVRTKPPVAPRRGIPVLRGRRPSIG
jgi:PilZ domain